MQNGISELSNPKWQDFEELGIRRREALQRNSVGGGLIHPDNQNIPSSVIGGRFNPFSNVLYASLDAEKANRIYEYRLMASFPDVSECIDIICNNFISENEDGNVINFKYNDPDLPPEILDEITQDFQDYIAHYELKRRGKKYLYDLLVDGEVFFEQIINTATEENKKMGVLGVQKLPTELMETVFKDKTNGIVGVYIGRQVTFDPTNPQQITNINFVPYNPNQIVYISTSSWDPTGEWIVPFIERGRKRYIQLSYLEDAIVIYRLVRAPERLVFKINTGSMPAPKAEKFLMDMQNRYWKTKTFDVNTGDIQSKFQPQAMLDAIWTSTGASGEGVQVDTLSGGQNLGQLDDLLYFQRALYRALRVPTNNLDPNSTASVDSSQLLKEELNFDKMIIEFHHMFEEGFKQGFIAHEKLMGKWKDYKLRENKIEIQFVAPTDYFDLRRMQSMQIRVDAYNKAISTEFLSKAWAAKHYLRLNKGQISLQYRMRQNEALLDWKIQQMQQNGPLWKLALQSQLTDGGGEPAEGGDMDFGGGDDFGGDFDTGGDMDIGGGDEGSDFDSDMDDMGSDADGALDTLES